MRKIQNLHYLPFFELLKLILQSLILLIWGLGCGDTTDATPSLQEKKTTPPTELHASTIGLQPFGQFSMAHATSVASVLEATFKFKVVVLPPQPLPAHTFVHIKTPRHRADSLIVHLRRQKKKQFVCVLGLTNKDISTTKRDKHGQTLKPASKYQDWGVFGLGFCPGVACIVSTYRLNSANPLFISQLKKISVHEVGHNFGLPHCPNSGCVMMDAAESIKTIDKVKLDFCSSCRMKLPKS